MHTYNILQFGFRPDANPLIAEHELNDTVKCFKSQGTSYFVKTNIWFLHKPEKKTGVHYPRAHIPTSIVVVFNLQFIFFLLIV